MSAKDGPGKGDKAMTGVDYAVQRRTVSAANILDMLVIFVFPFLGIEEMGEDRFA